MNRVVPALILCLGAAMALVLKAPPKVRENMTTYYKRLIQAPAARMTEFTTRVERKRTPTPVAKPAPKPAPTAGAGPNVTVMGGISWERTPHKASTMSSHTQTPKAEPQTAAVTPAEPTPAPVEPPQPAVSEVVPPQVAPSE
jgi:hypothetical protein